MADARRFPPPWSVEELGACATTVGSKTGLVVDVGEPAVCLCVRLDGQPFGIERDCRGRGAWRGESPRVHCWQAVRLYLLRRHDRDGRSFPTVRCSAPSEYTATANCDFTGYQPARSGSMANSCAQMWRGCHSHPVPVWKKSITAAFAVRLSV